jgi:hypothetical protein
MSGPPGGARRVLGRLFQPPHRPPHYQPPIDIVHHVVCRHQVEVEVMPARATLYWRDEGWIDPTDTQIRFDAVVYNADTGVTWQVLAPDGSPGKGMIDPSGLYRAPDKGTLPSGTTDIVIATARADPLRKAFAWVTLVGLGPAPAPVPRIEIWPKRSTLYYRTGANNDYMDVSNKQQLFRAFLTNAPDQQVRWTVDGAVQIGTEPWLLYQAPNVGGEALVTVRAQVVAAPLAQDDAKIILLNYNWPGL